ncbi:MAG: hypothetical protein NUW01_14350 [Gemmatimonadaceae bacterium]|nr:hypothetical protein [Gemmatimonadaceae bacterium]
MKGWIEVTAVNQLEKEAKPGLLIRAERIIIAEPLTELDDAIPGWRAVRANGAHSCVELIGGRSLAVVEDVATIAQRVNEALPPRVSITYQPPTKEDS